MRKQTGYVTLLFVLFTLSVSANHVDEYIQGYKDIAQREMNRSNIPASIILAQGIHESSWGRGELARESRNHFGIKCKDYWTGPTYYIEDDDYENGKLIKSCFRSYENVEASYIDHTNFLVDNDRYQGLFLYDRTDYKNWAKGLKQCGYATDPKYAEKLIRIIETHQLYLFDMISTPAMEAPTFYIPPHFLNNNEAADPLVYTNEQIQTTTTYTIEQDYNQEVISNFDYQVPVENIPESKEEETAWVEEEPATVYEPIEEIRIASETSYQNQLTAVIPNNSSRDKKIQNLTRKPRMSSGAGPR